MSNGPSIAIIVGEDMDLPAELLKKNSITCFNFNVNWEGVLQNRNKIYEEMRKNKDKKDLGIPHTSQPAVGLFKELYEKALKEHDEVVLFSLSSKLSGCFNSAVQAVEMLDKNDTKRVHVVDTMMASGASYFLLQDLLEHLKQKQSLKDAIENLPQRRSNITLIGMVEDPFWLQQGGRISPAIAMIVNQMKKIGIRPLFSLKEGKVALLNVRTKARSKVSGMYDFLVEAIGDNKAQLIITHADNVKEAEELAAIVKEKKQNIDILYINQLSPVFGAHVGPDSLIVSWNIL